MPELMVKLDNEATVPLRSCDWVFYAPCGCPRGVMMAVVGDEVSHDEDSAFLHFFYEGNKREALALAKRERGRGVTARLVSHDQYKAEVYPAMLVKCTHRPGLGASDA